MAHKTRKKLTKKEIKKDPVHDKLEAGLFFIQTHQKEVVGGLIALLLILLVGQYFMGRRSKASEEAMAGYITASQVYTQSMGAAAAEQTEQAYQGIEAAYGMAMQTWNANPQNSWARKSAILAAKIDIIRGNYDTAISTLSSVLSANPENDVRIPALLHMGIVLENRGSEQDLANAVSSYTEILSIAGEDRLVRAEALHGLSRISQIHQQYDQSEDYLEQALAISSDTTVFEAYRLEMLAGQME